mmetsp:Transcript_29470/g.67893  ORF Transcript_29470/g.67893 Transcript_29470/m.67893 type:complete len:141 (-) Transcript_29470:102-524(-)
MDLMVAAPEDWSPPRKTHGEVLCSIFGPEGEPGAPQRLVGKRRVSPLAELLQDDPDETSNVPKGTQHQEQLPSTPPRRQGRANLAVFEEGETMTQTGCIEAIRHQTPQRLVRTRVQQPRCQDAQDVMETGGQKLARQLFP